MKPAPFEYFFAKDIRDALGSLKEHGESAKVLAGGQSLMPLMNMRLARPEYIVDINRVPGLSGIQEAGGVLKIGSMTRYRELESSQLVRSKCPILAETIRHIGHVQIRTRGTIGGSTAHADPAAEIPGIITLLDGKIKLEKLDGERVLSAEEFFLSYLTTSLDPAEMIIEIELPTMSPKMGWSFMEQSLRRGDFALAGAGVTVELKDDLETCMVARIVFIGVDDKPVRGTLIEECLLGRPMNDLAIEEAGELVENIIDPESDIHAGVEYRLNLSKVILKRALKEAKKRAQEKASP
ncbi:MAG: xanthine dehydrogenase family protein subunit M [Desulfatiglandales bacterium]|nr:xanthine dehydrogenase family protein subunit M [Desulfatiglandales bacterium]